MVVSPMLTTALIAFREFFEAFLLAGVFLGLSKQLGLKKEGEILSAVGVGVLISLLLSVGVYFFGEGAREALNATSAELLGAYLMVFSGVFIAYVVFSLHGAMQRSKMDTVEFAKDVMKAVGFDITFFFLIVFLVLREGFEIALFTASVSLFSDFIQNVSGLLLGFLGASIAGTGIYFAYTKFPIKKIFMLTEYSIIATGAVMTAAGTMKLLTAQFGIGADTWLRISLPMLENPVSLMPAVIALLYVGIVYVMFIKKPALNTAS